MLKKRIPLFIAAILVIVLTSCSTFQPYDVSVSFPADGKYEVLGRVDYEGSMGIAGYGKLFEVAKTKYPGTDDVVNIIVDSKMVSFGGLILSRTYIMSGIAIKYK